MKNEKRFILIVTFIAVSIFTVIILITPKKPIPKKPIPKNVETIQEKNWKKLTNSIIFIESTNNDSAINHEDDCVGCLQITPVYVREVNRINKLDGNPKRYKLSDRYDRKKSIEMFNIYQKHKNPKKDLRKAIKLHNPTAGKWYEERIMAYYSLN